MKFRFRKYPKFFFVLLLGFLFNLSSCKKPTQPTAEEQAFLDSVKGQPGIFGEPDYIFGAPPKLLKQVWNATGLLFIPLRDGQSGAPIILAEKGKAPKIIGVVSRILK